MNPPVPDWLAQAPELAAAQLHQESRLQSHQITATGSYDDAKLQLELGQRVNTQSGVVMRELWRALRPLREYEFPDNERESVIEVVKLKSIASILITLPDEAFLMSAKALKSEASEILDGLIEDLRDYSLRIRKIGQPQMGSSTYGRGDYSPGAAYPSGYLSDIPQPGETDLTGIVPVNNRPYYDVF